IACHTTRCGTRATSRSAIATPAAAGSRAWIPKTPASSASSENADCMASFEPGVVSPVIRRVLSMFRGRGRLLPHGRFDAAQADLARRYLVERIVPMALRIQQCGEGGAVRAQHLDGGTLRWRQRGGQPHGFDRRALGRLRSSRRGAWPITTYSSLPLPVSGPLSRPTPTMP